MFSRIAVASRCRARSESASRALDLLIAPIAAAVMTWITWPVVKVDPQATVDWSWVGGLHIAADRGLDFGSELTFTYGPLGFLSVPALYFSATFALSVLFVGAAQFALGLSIIVALRTTLGWLVAIAAAYAGTALVGTSAAGNEFWAPSGFVEAATAVLFCWCLLALQGRLSRRGEPVFSSLAGGVAAVLLLVKFNLGAASIAIAALTFAALGLRALVPGGATFLATFAFLWIVTGQSLAALPDWVGVSLEIAAEYSAGQATETPGREAEYFLAAVVLAVLTAVLWRTPFPSTRRRIAALGIAALFMFSLLKAGFVRHDLTHSLLYFSCAALAFVPLAYGPQRWRALAGFGLSVLVVVAVARPAIRAVFDPSRSVRAAYDQFSLVVRPVERQARIAANQEAARMALGVDSHVLAGLRGREVLVDPYETTPVWAFNLSWRPLPLLQLYTAMSQRLDERNADLLSGPQAPERILREHVPRHVDGRGTEFESPAYFLASICNYVEVSATESWQVLERRGNRCGAPRLLRSATAEAGRPVTVPAPDADDELVFARFGVRRSPLRPILTTLYKEPNIPRIFINDREGYRFLPALAGSSHVMRVPASAGFSPSFSGRRQARTVTIHGVPSPVRFDFYAVRVALAR